MKWEKKGLIYKPKGDLWWARTYAHLPTAEVIDNEYIRVYFDALDVNKFGRVGYVDLDIDNPRNILQVSKEPILDIGDPGTFDDSGVNPSCVININGKKYLYYIGWQRAERVPYMLFSGLAISEDNGQTFNKYSKVPILDRTDEEPFSRAAPFVLIEDSIFKMWYWSCLEWSEENGALHYNNVIRYAESTDGIKWDGTDDVCIPLESDEEYSVGRPWVIKNDNLYRMWYSIRSKVKPYYRLGYAESKDGLNWVRKDDEVGITVSKKGWDSEQVCFSSIVDIEGKSYMFYNGNQNGKSGFGYAELVTE